ncbi:CAP domain-containing protein [Deinococcus aquaedulcis]|uniref:CAP domain-containing protein n=1 Tax=Deinococcus aquaedulcis TaxID=2840455 RepID=UPI001C82B1B6|nr:CAP domain-containing protein [Deinococcus aquaedulcis]
MGAWWWLRRALLALAWTLGLFALGVWGLQQAGWWPEQQEAGPVAQPAPAPIQVDAAVPGDEAPQPEPVTTVSPGTPQAPSSAPAPQAPRTLLTPPAPSGAAQVPSATAPSPAALAPLNAVRRRAGMAPVKLQAAWAPGCAAHARYLVREDRAEHRQDPKSPYHSAAGEACAPGHYFVSSQPDSGAGRAVGYWASGAFHLPQLLDPRLTQVALGVAHDGRGALRTAVVLDVRRGLGKAAGRYPVRYPAPGATGPGGPAAAGEWPDPTAGCAGLAGTPGAPVALLLGPDGPAVRSAQVWVNARPQPACLLTAQTFEGANASETRAGRQILAAQGAAVLLPHAPLPQGAQVKVRFDTARGPVGWAFRVGP